MSDCWLAAGSLAATEAELEQLNALSLTELATEVMAKERGFSFPLPAPEDFKLRDQIAKLVTEGLQEMEHASLERGEVAGILRGAGR